MSAELAAVLHIHATWQKDRKYISLLIDSEETAAVRLFPRCACASFRASVMHFHWSLFPQRGPGRFWALFWPYLVLLSAWPTPTWRCRSTHIMNAQSLFHILTCVSAPRNSPGAMATTPYSITQKPILCLMATRLPITERFDHSDVLCSLLKLESVVYLALFYWSRAHTLHPDWNKITCAGRQWVPFIFV